MPRSQLYMYAKSTLFLFICQGHSYMSRSQLYVKVTVTLRSSLYVKVTVIFKVTVICQGTVIFKDTVICQGHSYMSRSQLP